MEGLTKKHILLLTTTNLICNPRCCKEVMLLLEKKYIVTVVAFDLHNWSDDNEKILNNELIGANFFYIDTLKSDLITWMIATLVEKCARLFASVFPGNIYLASMAISKRSWQLMNWLKKNKPTPDLVIAHNPAAFYPAYYLAKNNNIPFALDVEDYHPGETVTADIKRALEVLMSNLMPKAIYVSYASPLIKERSEALNKGSQGRSIVINNFFRGGDFMEPVAGNNDKLQLVWFSQNIDKGRGLEQLLPVFEKFTSSFELTLLGNPKEAFCNEYVYNKKGIIVAGAMYPTALTLELGRFDVGLAIEPGKDLNNTLALSNKILGYFQAGLYILASDTAAQKLFMEQHQDHGICTELSQDALTKIFQMLETNMAAIKAQKVERYRKATACNWDCEAKFLLNEWNIAIA